MLMAKNMNSQEKRLIRASCSTIMELKSNMAERSTYVFKSSN